MEMTVKAFYLYYKQSSDFEAAAESTQINGGR